MTTPSWASTPKELRRARRERALQRAALSLSGLILASYGLNAAVIHFTQPVSVQEAAPERVVPVGGMELRAIEGLRSGGVGAFSVNAVGYVNMVSSEQAIYVSEKVLGEKSVDMYLYKHEVAHVLQKELLAQESGGYPSYWNPLRSMGYYYNLWRLNSDLERLMPPLKEENPVIFAGLEAAADCYAQPYSAPEEPASYTPNYIAEGCSAEQLKIVNRFLVGKWPQELSEAERAELVPTNVSSEPLKRVAKSAR